MLVAEVSMNYLNRNFLNYVVRSFSRLQKPHCEINIFKPTIRSYFIQNWPTGIAINNTLAEFEGVIKATVVPTAKHVKLKKNVLEHLVLALAFWKFY